MIENRKFRRECVFMRKYRLTAMLLAGLTAASLMTGCGSSGRRRLPDGGSGRGGILIRGSI